MRFETLDQWLEWLESRHVVRSSEVAFQQTKSIAQKLNLLPCKSKVITITGTNGKGSCVALLEAIYHAAGYQIGAYTSPHLIQFNERIRVNSQEVSDEKLYDAFKKVDQARGEIELNYFQFATLAALIIFQEANLDLIILEVGIGGRLDAVNIVDPDLSIISSIGLDHQAVLGDTRELVAIEKAGIMRSGKPVICGDRNPPSTLLGEAQRIGAKLYCQEREFDFVDEGDYWQWRVMDPPVKPEDDGLVAPRDDGNYIEPHSGEVTPDRHSGEGRNPGCPKSFDSLPLGCHSGEGRNPGCPKSFDSLPLGCHSGEGRNPGCLHSYDHLPTPKILLDNASTVLMAVTLFQSEMPVSEKVIHQGLIEVKVLGRFQIEKVNDITVIFDVAHNPQAAANLVKRLETIPVQGKRFVVVGMMKDKDIEGTLKCFQNRVDAWFVPALESSRAAEPELITKLLKKMGEQEIRCYPSAQAAFQGAYQQAVSEDLIIVFGSFVTVGNIIQEVN